MDLAGKRIGNYVAKSELGSGGMGVVYLCEHPLIRRRVAAKVLHEELAASEDIVRRLFAEAKAANEINSEHIVEVLDFGRMEDNGRELVYLLMEFLEGEGLGHRLWRTGLTIDESLAIMEQCCEALEASHKAGIIHRDLKPENIFLLDRRGDPNFVKILDFGIAKVSGSPSTKTRTGVLLGTPAYMSPEQCRGSGAVDARADVYSLGIVLYELTTGDVPFNGDGYGQVLLAQMTEKPRPPSEINKDLPKVVEALVMKALEKDPANRFQSMAEFGRAIADAETALGHREPVAQIPRKGLHVRETFVRNGRKRGTIDGALAQIAPTPIDAALSGRMADVSISAPTQQMDAVDDPALASDRPGTLKGLQPANAGEAASTVFDQRMATQLREAVREHQETAAAKRENSQVDKLPKAKSEPATEMRRDGAGNMTTGPQGMVAPAAAPKGATPVGGVATVLNSQLPTMVRQVVAAPMGAEGLPTGRMDGPLHPARRGRWLVIALTALLLSGAALIYFLRYRY